MESENEDEPTPCCCCCCCCCATAFTSTCSSRLYAEIQALRDSIGLLRQPKRAHLKDLHRAIKLCEPALVPGDPTVIPLGNYQEAHIFKSKLGDCAAFLANYNSNSFAKLAFGNMLSA